MESLCLTLSLFIFLQNDPELYNVNVYNVVKLYT